ncbi:MAG: ribosome silencing factor [Lachnospiraceae bacterium]|nr:ribosome silencing factor [Lachnospiraceae bacterium]
MKEKVSEKMLKIAYDALDEKKASDITVIDIAGVSTIADYYVITNGENPSHVQALVENVQEKMYKSGYACRSLEGFKAANWVLMDYGDIVVNVFSRDDRRWFDLERIWRDGRFLDASEIEAIEED